MNAHTTFPAGAERSVLTAEQRDALNGIYENAKSAGADAADKQMRANGRSVWNEADFALSQDTMYHALLSSFGVAQ